MSNLALFTLVHVAISLVGIVTGFVVAYGLLINRRWDRSTALFLSTTLATSLTGFLFPADRITPAHVLGVLSVALLAVAIISKYRHDFAGRWRAAYVISSLAALYLNIFVLIVQSFQKVPALKALAPTQSEPPFAIVQLLTLIAFVAVGRMAVRRFRPGTISKLRELLTRTAVVKLYA